ncbi:MAG: DNA primase [Pseudobutyrivibrio sp.]|nr:DNA primase [Pseudobutyrivibrio sp.]
MSVFDDVKSRISVRDAAYFYGFHPNRAGMIVCPFHNDKRPSCKVDGRFHCFACQADGDVIDFVSRLYGIRPLDSARKLAQDFGISAGGKPDAGNKTVLPKLSQGQQRKLDERHCLNDLIAYQNKLRQWKLDYAPKSKEEELDERFVEACQRKDYMDYLVDLMLWGEAFEREDIIEDWKKGKIYGVKCNSAFVA